MKYIIYLGQITVPKHKNKVKKNEKRIIKFSGTNSKELL